MNQSSNDRDRDNKSIENEDLSLDQPPSKRRKWIVIAILLLLSTLGIGTVVGWYLIEKKLLPLVETEAGKYLRRPLSIGKLQSVSLTSARVGKSKLPPTQDNPDHAVVETVKVKFNLLPLLFKKTLPLDIILIQPDVYIEQDKTGLWTPTDFGTGEKDGTGIKVDVETIQLQEADITLVARKKNLTKELNPPVKGEFNEGIVRFLEDGKIIQFDATGNLDQGGKLNLTGKAIAKVIDIDIDAQKLAPKALDNLLGLPLSLDEGTIDATIRVKLDNAPLPKLYGTAEINDVALQIPGLPKPFSNSNGKLHFQDSEITLDQVRSLFGEVKGIANGSLDISGAGKYNISAKSEPIDVNKVFSALELTPTPVPLQGEVKSDIAVKGILDNPVVQIAVENTTPTRIDQLDFNQVQGNLELIGSTLFVRNFSSQPTMGGIISGNGTIQLDDNQNVYFDVRGRNLPGNKIAEKYNTKLPIELGLVSGRGALSFQATDLKQTFHIVDGVANFSLGNGIVAIENLNYRDGIWRSQIQANDVEFDSLPFGKGTTPTIGKALVDGTFKASGEINDPKFNTVVVSGNATLNTVGGVIYSPDIRVSQGIWQGDFITSNIQLRQLFPEIPTEFNDNVGGDFYLTGKIVEDNTITGKGDLVVANGQVTVAELVVAGKDWQTNAIAKNLELKQLSSTTPDQFAGLVNGQFNLSGTIDNITPEGIIAQGNGSLTLPEGVFTANNLNIKEGNFVTQIIPEGVDLSLFADPNSEDLILEGNLGGELTATGKIDQLDPTAVNAKGYVSFSKGIDLIDQAFTANIVWNGSRLDILQANGNSLNATGYIELANNFFTNIPNKLAAVKDFRFNVIRANAIDLNRLKINLPSWAINLERSGKVDFTGKISGIPSAMDIDGNINLRNFFLENIAFNNLQGTVRVTPGSGVNLALSDGETRGTERQRGHEISLNLDQDFLPQSFTFANNDFLVTGIGRQEIVQMEVQDIPLELLKTIAIKTPDLQIPPKLAAQPLAGKLSGDFTTNLYNLNTSGKNVVVISPILGKIQGNQIVGNFQYGEGYLALDDVKFQQGMSKYQFQGSLSQKDDDIQMDGELSVEEGEIQNILIALEIFELSDFGKPLGDRKYGKSQDLYPQSSSNSNPLFALNAEDTAIWQQLQKLAAIQAWINQKEQEQQKDLRLPELRELKGNFAGKVAVSGSLNQGLDADFQFQGKKWRWGKTKPEDNPEKNLIAEQIIFKGDYREGILTILPIVIDLPQPLPNNLPETATPSNPETALNPKVIISGSAGGETLLGKLTFKEIPISLIKRFVTLPKEIAFGGIIEAEATISGKQSNPDVLGEITIRDTTLNDTLIESTQGSFNYSNARLNFFGSSIVAENADPVTLEASIPYELPFADTKPETDLLKISLNVKNRGLTLLNILSQGEVNWIDGAGEIVLDIDGSYDQANNQPRNLIARGSATINQGKIALKSLPNQYLTEVEGNIDFNFDRISVQSVTGKFGNGEISALGTIPLSRPTPQDNPLTINLENLTVDLKELYRGEVAGQISILGTTLEPDITGNIILSNGTVVLNNTTTAQNVTIPNTTGISAVTEYKNLKLQLGNNIFISQPPIFTFLATGTLDLGGTFLFPIPEGTIRLEKGQLNLFTTQLNLARGENNTARFTRNNILDPYLEVTLVGSAIENSRNLILQDPTSTEIPDIRASQIGTLDTVDISAEVRGLASQITNSIQLTSSPPRSQPEILALLGGNFFNTIGSGSGTLGLASALFGSLNAQFTNLIPFGEIRLFPAQLSRDENNPDRRLDALAGEIAFDITDKFSFSVLQILNIGDVPTQFGVRYRFDQNFVLRGSTNFQDDTRTVVEYELRF
ncbi:MAG: translocation/assembly module TamB domain-containing protein [Xenococcaceae cyanobacterium MO_167.B52]|nr:translocation/assembly module TamB domain-containing protein [Xenococcaceae cyanobacterium MO_167.B52]